MCRYDKYWTKHCSLKSMVDNRVRHYGHTALFWSGIRLSLQLLACRLLYLATTCCATVVIKYCWLTGWSWQFSTAWNQTVMVFYHRYYEMMTCILTGTCFNCVKSLWLTAIRMQVAHLSTPCCTTEAIFNYAACWLTDQSRHSNCQWRGIKTQWHLIADIMRWWLVYEPTHVRDMMLYV